MRYFGTKSSTLDAVVRASLSGIDARTAADAFGGLGTIGVALRNEGIQVTTCDVLGMPHAFQHTRVVLGRRPYYLALRQYLGVASVADLLLHIRELSDHRSWIVREFSTERKFFTRANAAKISGIWMSIASWKSKGLLSKSEECHLVASLVNSADRCANTAGTYYAYLKEWDRRAIKSFEFSWLDVPAAGPPGRAIRGDAIEVLGGDSFDLLYLDPPYNSRDYSRYYHFPESLASLKRPKTDGRSMAGVPILRSKGGNSREKSWSLEYVQRLVAAVQWRRCVLHYCEGAHVSLDHMREMLSCHGKVEALTIDAASYTTVPRSRASKHHLFIVDK
ncbi:DNA adenine methylase [Stenotrophomonas sp. SPM]|uniref:DNA adenine methylase n=1 Tax=Stenotrophomonas sp. SPM TaxID=2170735 RepID=UPI001402D943|nr:DNA adenine methylase [Stenotrophomonas sp. SPM]